MIRPDDLAAKVLKGLVNRAGVSADLIEDVILGCVTQIGEQGVNIARTAALIAGFPFMFLERPLIANADQVNKLFILQPKPF